MESKTKQEQVTSRHIISEVGLKQDDENVRAIVQMSPLENRQTLLRFKGSLLDSLAGLPQQPSFLRRRRAVQAENPGAKRKIHIEST